MIDSRLLCSIFSQFKFITVVFNFAQDHNRTTSHNDRSVSPFSQIEIWNRLSQSLYDDPREKLDFSPSRGQYGDFIDQELKRIHQNDISSLIDYINECLDVKSLILICDEGEPEYGEYNGSSSLGKKGISCRLTLNILPIFPLPALLPALTCIWQAEFLLSPVQCWKSLRLVCSYCAKASLPFTKRYPRNLDAEVDIGQESKNRTKDQEMRASSFVVSCFLQLQVQVSYRTTSTQCHSLQSSECKIIDVFSNEIKINPLLEFTSSLDEQNVVLLSASCTISGKPIKRNNQRAGIQVMLLLYSYPPWDQKEKCDYKNIK
ncbi:hypothetical protein RIR_jg6024.t1 [Rhizophagus irregularis DAOM 181602=DAOM 197198]|nr:hypothetical protein RIR_jg6024.t1 [Rhizophagus irregularis DAOM 181602=DAOM 197198]